MTEIARMNAAQRSAKSASAYLNHIIGLGTAPNLMLHCLNALGRKGGQLMLIPARSVDCILQHEKSLETFCSGKLGRHQRLPRFNMQARGLLISSFLQ